MSKGEKTLWNLAIDEANGIGGKNKMEEVSVIFLGSKNSGKTSMILRFLDRDETPKPTVALEYTFARRAKGHNIAKEVGHIWELGGGTWLTQLADIPITPDAIKNMSVILVLDLSSPEELWYTMENMLETIKKAVTIAIKEAWVNDPSLKDYLKEKTWSRVGEEHPDRDMLDPFPIPLIIVGGKYDLFQEFESEKRKIICRTLRFVAHTHGAHLQFFSTKHQDLLMRSKALISHILFGTQGSKSPQFEHHKPLLITPGSDSLQQIGSPPLPDGELGRLGAKTPMELWKVAFTAHVDQKSAFDPSQVKDPAKDSQYAESTIDEIRKQKDEELERYRRITERKAKEAQRQLAETIA